MTDIVWQSVVLQTVSFLIFVFLLGKILFAPVIRVLEERNGKIESLEQTAQTAGEEADRLRTSFQLELDDARREAGRLMDDLRVEANAKREELLAEMRAKVQKMRNENSEALRKETDAAISQLEPYVKELGKIIAEKAIGRRLVS